MRFSLTAGSTQDTANLIGSIADRLEKTGGPAPLIEAARALRKRMGHIMRFIPIPNPGASQIHFTDAETRLLIALDAAWQGESLSQHALLAILQDLARDERIDPPTP